MDYGSVVKNKTKKSPGKLTLLEKKILCHVPTEPRLTKSSCTACRQLH